MIKAAAFVKGPTAARSGYRSRMASADIAACLIISTAALFVMFNAPVNGGQWWSDAARHALNGAFLLDMARDLPRSASVEWAYSYYRQYPALTILFYPPFFPFVLAVFYGLFGVSQAIAISCVGTFYLAAALGTYALARRLMPPSTAVAAALLLAGAPDVTFWGRQVMLEIPALALATWSSWLFLNYLSKSDRRFLIASVVMLLCCLYTKQTFMFLLLVFGAAAAWAGKLREKALWIAVAVGAVGVLPLGWLQFRYGSFNVVSAVERADVGIARGSASELFWYAEHLPQSMGYVGTGLAAAYLALVAVRHRHRRPKISVDAVFHAAWLLFAYAFFTAIHLKETRHGIPIFLPLAIAGGAFLHLVLPPGAARALPVALGLAVVAETVWSTLVPNAAGYRKAVHFVLSEAPPRSRVLFLGNERDGTFIFEVRAQGNPNDVTVVRADKILLDKAIIGALGLHERDIDMAGIRDLFRRYGIRYVVVAEGYDFKDVEVMKRLHQVLGSEQFQEVERFRVEGGSDFPETDLVVLRNNGDVSDPPETIGMNLRAARVEIPGSK